MIGLVEKKLSTLLKSIFKITMTIYVTQGHEKGIGLEIFFKSYSLLSLAQKKSVVLIAFHRTIQEHLKLLSIPSYILNSLNIIEPATSDPKNKDDLSQSMACLLEGISRCKNNNNDVLLTLPTSKDQLTFKGLNYLGHTEFLRFYFQKPYLPMSFIGPKNLIFLLTDHIPLNTVGDQANHQSLDELFLKSQTAIEGFKNLFPSIHTIAFSGINPHCGEGGLLGNEDQIIQKLKIKLQNKLSFTIEGPLPGDTLHLSGKHSINSHVLAYYYHDQGLSFFKSNNGFIGINVTFGLPFLRLSVDHGTAFPLFGKSIADISSMIYIFHFLLNGDRSNGKK